MSKKKKPNLEDDGCFDGCFNDFIQDATLAVRAMWEESGGTKLSDQETFALNDLLTAYFQDKQNHD